MFQNSLFPKYVLARIRRIYFMALPENKQDFKKSRVYYTMSDSAAQTIVQLSGGTFLATLMVYCGVSDSNIGIITSLLSLAALIQLFMISYLKKIKKYKLFVCITALQRMLFFFIYLIPLFALSNTLKAVIIVILYFIGQIFVQVGTPASQDWIASLVPGRLRGKYFTIKDSIAVFIVSSVMLLAGVILDYFKTRNLLIGFILIGVLIFILTVINVVGLSLMKEPKLAYMNSEGKEMHGRLAKKAKFEQKIENDKTESILFEIKEAFLNRRFRKAFTLQCIYTLAFYTAAPFIPSYQINELKLPYTVIMLVSFLFNLYRVYLSPKLGKLADKHGMAKITRYSLIVLGTNFLAIGFTMPQNAYPMLIVSCFLASTAWAFVGIGLFGVQLDFFKNEKRMIWLTLTSSISGLFGFVVSIFAGRLLDHLQKKTIMIFDIKIYAQQVLNLISFLILMFAAYYIKYHMETEKIESNHMDGRITG